MLFVDCNTELCATISQLWGELWNRFKEKNFQNMGTKAEKIWKKTLRDLQKRLKPGECLKYVRIVIDSRLLKIPIGQDIITQLNAAEIRYDIRQLPERQCIIWERSIGQRELVNSDVALDAKSNLTEEWARENQVIKVITAAEFQTAVKEKTLEIMLSKLKLAFPEMHYTYVMHKLQEKGDTMLNALVELQILYGVNVRELTEGKEDLFCVLRCFTKSIAEAPFKEQKNEKLDNFKKYLANDKKQCVRVEGRNGYGRLWQQHLNRLPLVTLEVAEAIIAQYPCPKVLLDVYATDMDAANVLADLKIQRGGPQPLQTDRRIGNVLSQKLHTLYTTRDPKTLI